MKLRRFLWAGVFLASCQTTTPLDQIVSQKYVHKYGFDVSPEEWEERTQDGQIVSMLKDGVKITRSYENGKLHGSTTYTFPHSEVIEKLLVYDQGALLKETLYDPAGIPIREEIYEFDDRTIISLWDEKGVPLSIEEYEGELLVDGKYYTSDHELEGQIVDGFGNRIKRDRTGLLLLKDQIERGEIASRITYHPSGQIHTVSHYSDHQLHGEQLKYTATGKPLMHLNWDHGILDGLKISFRNGSKIAEVPYVKGQKEGVERHFDDLGYLTAEISWQADQKHGASKLHSEEETEIEWFYRGQSVSAEKFENLEARDQVIAKFMVDSHFETQESTDPHSH